MTAVTGEKLIMECYTFSGRGSGCLGCVESATQFSLGSNSWFLCMKVGISLHDKVHPLQK